MASEIKLPELGENLEGGEVLDVKVGPGDSVQEGQPLLEVEAEKSTVEIPSPVAGRIAKVLVNKGDQVKVGQTFVVIEGGDGKKGEGAKVAPAKPAPDAEAEPDTGLPGESTGEPTGEDVRRVEKAAKEPPKRQAERTGNGRRPEPTRPARAADEAPSSPPVHEESHVIPAGPAARRLARELGVDLSRVPGSAHRGRVTQEDIKAYVRQLASAPAGPRGPGAPPPLPDFGRWGPVERQPLEAVRRRTAEQMSLSWSQVPHVTQHDAADITDLEAFRKEQSAPGGPKLTVTAFALKATAIALRRFPQFNSSLDWAAGQLVFKWYYHIGVAVDTDRGLLVPVVHDVDHKGVEALAAELNDLAERARQKKVTREEMQGGTFTITNLGGIGGTAFTPIVNYPEVAILGLSRARLQPTVYRGEVVPRLVLPISLSYDHRVIDGADAARFARLIADLLENPLKMVLHA